MMPLSSNSSAMLWAACSDATGLGKTLEQYFVKDFWKDHKKMYQNRPIYWLFSIQEGCLPRHRLHASHECLHSRTSTQGGPLHLDVVLTCLKNIVPTLLHHRNRTCASVRSLRQHSWRIKTYEKRLRHHKVTQPFSYFILIPLTHIAAVFDEKLKDS